MDCSTWARVDGGVVAPSSQPAEVTPKVLVMGHSRFPSSPADAGGAVATLATSSKTPTDPAAQALVRAASREEVLDAIRGLVALIASNRPRNVARRKAQSGATMASMARLDGAAWSGKWSSGRELDHAFPNGHEMCTNGHQCPRSGSGGLVSGLAASVGTLRWEHWLPLRQPGPRGRRFCDLRGPTWWEIVFLRHRDKLARRGRARRGARPGRP